MPQIRFIHSGTFVDSGGQPTLKLVGEVTSIDSHLVQPTAVVRTPLHGPDILRAFLKREPVLSPLDYVKQICFEPSQFHPVYFFINQTRMEITEVVAELGKVDCRAAKRDKLANRLQADESFTYGKLGAETDAARKRQEIYEGLVQSSLTDEDAASNLIHLFHALTHLRANNADPDYVLPLVLRVAMPKYTSLPSRDAGFMRKAICHLDVIWFKQSSTGRAGQSVQLVAKAG